VLIRLLTSLILPRPPTSTLFPYTTLFRSLAIGLERADAGSCGLTASCNLELTASNVTQLTPIDVRVTWDNTGATTVLSVQYASRSEEHTSELQSRVDLVCRLLLEKKKKIK